MFSHRFFFVVFCTALVFISCKKNNTPGDDADPGADSSKAVPLSEKIVLYHGVLTKGSMPLPSGTGPQISSIADNQPVIALAGKYVVIKPQILSGEIAGYFLRIAGDSTAYFKIDFSTPPLSGRKRAGLKAIGFSANYKKSGFTSGKTMDDPDYNDSLIVIKLPEDMKPGIFCVEYMGYDKNNDYGNIIKKCITIEAAGGDSRFSGKWKLNKSMSNDSVEGNTGWADAYAPLGVSVETFYCVDDQLETYPQSPDDIPDSIVMNDYRLTKYELSLSPKGSFSYEFRFVERSLDADSSTCSNLVYDIIDGTESLDNGAWTYNPTTKKLIILYYDDWPGTDNLDFAEWNIEKIQENRFVVYFPANENSSYEEWWEFIKTE